jgi:hypothetical protein
MDLPHLMTFKSMMCHSFNLQKIIRAEKKSGDMRQNHPAQKTTETGSNMGKKQDGNTIDLF